MITRMRENQKEAKGKKKEDERRRIKDGDRIEGEQDENASCLGSII